MKTALRIAIVLGAVALAVWLISKLVGSEPELAAPIEVADEDLVEASA